MEKTIEFLYKAIADSQATVRAIDVKLGFLFIIIFAPLFSIDKLYPLINSIAHTSTPALVMTVAIGVIWALSVFSQFMALMPISNPANRVVGGGNLGIFFGGDLYSLSMADAFLNLRSTPSRSLDDDVNALPKDDDSIIKELAFEKAKLTYIKIVKMKRADVSTKLILSWLTLSLFTYTYYVI